MTNELKEELEHLNWKGALPPVFTGRRTALTTMNINSSSVPQFLFTFFFFSFFLVLFFVLFVVVFLSLCVKESFFEYNWVS